MLDVIRKIASGKLVSKELIRLLPESGLVIIAGGIGSGKSALSYSILEYCHYDRFNIPIYIYGFPGSKELLPKWIRILGKEEEFPESSIIFLDEAYLAYYARQSQNKKNKWIDRFAGLVRQKNILGLFVSQTLRKLDVGLLSGSQLLLLKKPPYLQTELDRSELRGKLKTILKEYQKARSEGYDIHKCTYAISNDYDFEGLIRDSNSTPTFWEESLSKIWAGVKLN